MTDDPRTDARTDERADAQTDARTDESSINARAVSAPRAPRVGTSRRVTAPVWFVLLSALFAAACTIPPGSLDGPIAVILHITTTPTTVDVDAETWYSDSTAIYLCPMEPPPLPDPGPALIGWTPGAPCHDYGTRPSPDGLKVALPIAELDGPDRALFGSAEEWYLLLLDIDGDRVSSAIRSAFRSPVSPGLPEAS
jgi:hypothetical protein